MHLVLKEPIARTGKLRLREVRSKGQRQDLKPGHWASKLVLSTMLPKKLLGTQQPAWFSPPGPVFCDSLISCSTREPLAFAAIS